jgi:hypothetical protein
MSEIHFGKLSQNPSHAAAAICAVATTHRNLGQIWVWDRGGSGDFTRISSPVIGQRWLVVFDHESERSPWGEDPEQLADGFEWIDDYDLALLRGSDELLTTSGPMSATEVYKSWLDRHTGLRTWKTSPTIAELNNDFVSTEPELSPAEIAMFRRLVASEEVPLSELVDVAGSQLAGAAAMVTIDRIRIWLGEDRRE